MSRLTATSKRNLIDVLLEVTNERHLTKTQEPISRAEAERRYEAFVDTVKTLLAEDTDSVSLPQLFTLRKKNLPEREARNPRTQETIVVPPTTKISIRPKPSLVGEVNADAD